MTLDPHTLRVLAAEADDLADKRRRECRCLVCTAVANLHARQANDLRTRAIRIDHGITTPTQAGDPR